MRTACLHGGSIQPLKHYTTEAMKPQSTLAVFCLVLGTVLTLPAGAQDKPGAGARLDRTVLPIAGPEPGPITTLDARLCPEPIYGQVPALAGVDRGIADLLSIERSGRLVVLEIKATEDIHLPLQALDYWMRVAWHAERNEFTALGYFPGHAISADSPRLLLVAPALEFHPTTETILSFFSSVVAVERMGVGLEWRQELRLLFRLHGAARPA